MATLPPSGQYLSHIRSSCRQLRLASGVQVEPDNIKRLLTSPAFTTSFERVSKDHGLLLPLNFSSHLEELNFISILSLLNFASGFRVPLHAQTGRGAWDSIRALCFSLYISSSTDGDLLSAKGMQTLSIAKIAELMGVNLHVEKPHPKIHGITVGELGGPLYELVKMIADVLTETGTILEESSYPTLGAFVAEALQQAGKVSSSDDAMLEVVLERIVKAFPAFRDMAIVQEQPVYCFKKALFLIHAIYVRFGSRSPPPFTIPKTHNSPVFSDNVLPSLLVHLGVITFPPDSDLAQLFTGSSSEHLESLLGPPPSLKSPKPPKVIPKEGPIVTTEQSYILRATAIDACELILEEARKLGSRLSEEQEVETLSSLTLPDLDMWLWAVAKDRPDYRELERFVDRNTIYF